MDLQRENDIEQLRKVALVQQRQLERLLDVLAAQSERLDALTGGDGELQRALELLESYKGSAPSQDDARRPRRKQRTEPKKRETFGATKQPKLRVDEEVFELDEPDKVCPSCGGELRVFEGQYDETELVDVIEVSYRVVRCKQQKYVCACGGCVETAPGPERATPGGRYSLDFAAKVAIDKYLDHIPLERQARIMKRHGLDVSSQTLWKQLDVLARDLGPVYAALRAHILGGSQPVIGLDQTSWKRLSNREATPYQMWCVTAPGAVLHTIRNDKGTETFVDLVGDFSGVIVCDMMSTHAAGARASPGEIVLAACWAHVYRKFRDAAPNHPDAIQMMNWISELYDLDAKAGDDLELRGRIRRKESTETLARMKEWLLKLPVLRSLDYGQAAQYANGHWTELTRFVEDARIPLDNNATERGIRGPVVGRRNHFGSKSRRGTEVASIFYSLLETAKLNDREPAAYLADAVRAARRGEVVLPIG